MGKSGILEHKSGKISLKRVKIDEKLLGGPIGTHQRSFERYHPWPPIRPPLPKVRDPNQNWNPYYLRNR